MKILDSESYLSYHEICLRSLSCYFKQYISNLIWFYFDAVVNFTIILVWKEDAEIKMNGIRGLKIGDQLKNITWKEENTGSGFIPLKMQGFWRKYSKQNFYFSQFRIFFNTVLRKGQSWNIISLFKRVVFSMVMFCRF